MPNTLFIPLITKKILFTLCSLFFCLTVYGSHIAGGEISYTYIGDSTGINHHYKVVLRLIRDIAPGNSSLDPTETLTYSSSCSSSLSITVNRKVPPVNLNAGDNGFLISDFGLCSQDTSFTTNYSIHYYEAFVTLPGTCADGVFYFDNSCCRNSAINNFQNAGFSGFIVSATLNNTKGENSTPTSGFDDDIKIYCVGTDVCIFPFSEEKDGDSLHYKFTHPVQGSYPGNPLLYAGGYSVTNPFTSSTPVTIDPHTGIISFSPTQVEVCVIAILIEEWRVDTLTGIPYLISELHKDLQVVITASCDTSTQNWALQKPNNTIGYQIHDCADSTIAITTTHSFRCNSLSTDGSDFIIYKTDGSLLSINSASTPCNDHGVYSKNILLHTAGGFSENDTLYVVSKIGNDSNTLSNKCGYYLKQNDTVPILVQNCSGVNLNEFGFSKKLELYPNPAREQVNLAINNQLKEKTATITIVDFMGKTINSYVTNFGSNNSHQVNILDLNVGLYFIKIAVDDNMTYSSTFVKR